MYEELFYQIINTSAVNQAVIVLLILFCYYKKFAKFHYRKEKISVAGSEQRRDALFWIHLKETWLNVFTLL